MMTIQEKHVEYFCDEKNFFENDRSNKQYDEDGYFFGGLKAEAPTDRLSKLNRLETTKGIVYEKELSLLIPEKEGPEALYLHLCNNDSISKHVGQYVTSLEADLKKTKNEKDAVRLIDYYICINDIIAAARVQKETNVRHDILDMQKWAGSQHVNQVSAISLWTGLCQSSRSRFVAKIHLAHLTNAELFQALIADHDNLRDAFILSSFHLGNSNLVTKLLHRKWIEKEKLQRPRVDPSQQKELDEFVRDDLLTAYRATICLADFTSPRFNSPNARCLREIFILGIQEKKCWNIVYAIVGDISVRFDPAELIKDTLMLVTTAAEISAALLKTSKDEGSNVTKIINTGGSLMDILENSHLSKTIFARNLEAFGEELDDIVGIIEANLRALRVTMKRMKLKDNQLQAVNDALNFANGLFRLLFDFDTAVDAVKPIFPSIPEILTFLSKDAGRHFCNQIQNERLSELLAAFNATECLSIAKVSSANLSVQWSENHSHSTLAVDKTPSPTMTEIKEEKIAKVVSPFKPVDLDDDFETAFSKKLEMVSSLPIRPYSPDGWEDFVMKDHGKKKSSPVREDEKSGFKQPNPFGPSVTEVKTVEPLPDVISLSLSSTGWEDMTKNKGQSNLESRGGSITTQGRSQRLQDFNNDTGRSNNNRFASQGAPGFPKQQNQGRSWNNSNQSSFGGGATHGFRR